MKNFSVALAFVVSFLSWSGGTLSARATSGSPVGDELSLETTRFFSALDGSSDDLDGAQDGVLTVGALEIEEGGQLILDISPAVIVVEGRLRMRDEGRIRGASGLATGPDLRIEVDELRLRDDALIDVGGSDVGGTLLVCAGDRIRLRDDASLRAQGAAGGCIELRAAGDVELEEDSKLLASGSSGAGGLITILGCHSEPEDAVHVEGRIVSRGGADGGHVRIEARRGGVRLDDDSLLDVRGNATDGSIEVTAATRIRDDGRIEPSATLLESSPSDFDCGCGAVQNGLGLAPIGAQTVALGSTLELQLVATGAEAPTFFVRPLPLPAGARLDAMTGAFTFRPTELDVGMLELTFGAADGDVEVTELVSVVVAGAVAGSGTRLSGRLLDTNDFVQGVDTPISGARISILGSGVVTTSAADGSFQLGGLPAGDQIFDIDASSAAPAPDGSAYAGFREKLELVEDVDNSISRPFFLPRIDATSLTPVDPGQTTVVTNAALGIELTVPPGAALNADGTSFTGALSISRVPEALAPASLPPFLEPGLLITLQPVGVRYANPVPISFPNTDSLPEGSEVDLWSLDPDSGAFFITGRLRVSAGILVTISGGVIANDWHGPAPAQPDDDSSDQQEDDDFNPDECTGASGSRSGLHSGRLIIDHQLPSYRSMGRERSLRLVYNSTSADPQPLIRTNTGFGAATPLPVTLSTRISIGGLELGELFTTTSGPQGDLPGPARLVCPFDATNTPTGQLPYLLRISANYPQTTISRLRAGSVLINNERSSPFGAGWTLAGLQRLRLQSGGTRAVLTEGTGSIKVFTPQQSLSGVATDLAFVLDGSGSVSPSEFAVQIEGLASAIEDPLTVPPDGSTAFAVVQFSSFAVIEIPLTIIDSTATAQAVATQVRAITRLSGGTAIHAGLDSATQALQVGSPQARQVICLSTDGGSNAQLALTAAVNALNAGIEEIDTIGIGTGINGDLLMQIANVGNGFFVTAPTFQAFAETVDDKLQAVIGGNPPGEFSVLTKNDDGSFSRRMKDGTEHAFDAAGMHVSTTERSGDTMLYAYDPDGNLVTVTDSQGFQTLLAYAGGRLMEIVDPFGRTTRFEHDPAGCLTRIVDADGSERRFAYDSRARLTSQTSKNGFTTSYVYGPAGRHISTSLPDGTTRSLQARDIVGLVDPAGGTGSPGAPAPFSLASEARGVFIDGDGGVYRTITNAFGAATCIEDPLGRLTDLVRDGDNLICEMRHPNGRLDRFEYDSRGNVRRVLEAVGTPLARTRTFTYNEFSQVTRAEDGEGGVATFVYDDRGNLTSSVDPNGAVVIRTYVPGTDLLATVTDERGNTTSYGYDGMGRLETIVDAEGVQFLYGRDLAGNVASVTDAVGTSVERTKLYGYDAHNRLTSSTDGAGNTTLISYDSRGNEVSRTNPSGEALTRTFDSLDRLLSIGDSARGTTLYAYDGRGNVVRRTDPLGRDTDLEYDSAGQLLRTVDPLGGVESFTYDAEGRVSSFTDANGNTSTFLYDALGRRTRRCNALQQCVEYSHDRRDNVTRKVTAKGDAIVYGYDGRSQLTSISEPGNLSSFQYDPAGNLTAVLDGDSEVRYQFDRLGRTTGVSWPLLGYSLAYSMDALGNRVGVTDSGGQTTTMSYDDAGRITRVSNGDLNVVDMTRDATGRIRNISYPNGFLASYQREPGSGRLQRLSVTRQPLRARRGPSLAFMDGLAAGGTVLDFSYEYDARGNAVRIQSLEGLTSYAYDELGRLVGATGPLGTESYQYDAAGNRISSHLSSGYVYDGANRLIEDDQRTYTYDANGALTSETARTTGETITYAWDARSQLTSISRSSGVSQFFEYDGLRRRSATIEDDGAGGVSRRDYLHDDAQVLLELDSGAVDRRYTYGALLDQHLSVTDAAGVRWFHGDHLGTIRALTNAAGGVTAAPSRDSFGRQLVAAGGDAGAYGFIGRSSDSSAPDLYYVRNRFYDARVGRFISEDPSEYSGDSANLYGYALNDPVNFRDSDGLERKWRFDKYDHGGPHFQDAITNDRYDAKTLKPIPHKGKTPPTLSKSELKALKKSKVWKDALKFLGKCAAKATVVLGIIMELASPAEAHAPTLSDLPVSCEEAGAPSSGPDQETPQPDCEGDAGPP